VDVRLQNWVKIPNDALTPSARKLDECVSEVEDDLFDVSRIWRVNEDRQDVSAFGTIDAAERGSIPPTFFLMTSY
jgi:hypothetical protein